MSMNDVKCPYCGEGQEINHDDGYGYGESERHEQECGDCGKKFTFTTSISYYYEAERADCLNGEPHDLKPLLHMPNIWPDWKRCRDCDYEERGEYREPAKTE